MKNQTPRNYKEEYLKDTLILDVRAPGFDPKESHYQIASFGGNSRVVALELIKDFKLRPFKKEFEGFTCFMGAGRYFDPFIQGEIHCMCMLDDKLTKIVKTRNFVNQDCDMRVMIEFIRKG